MGKDGEMAKVDLSKTQFSPATLEHMKIMEKINIARVKKVKFQRRRSNILTLSLAGIAISTYFYSMYAVRQEGFLDDFEEPELKRTDN